MISGRKNFVKLFLVILVLFISSGSVFVYGQTVTPTPTTDPQQTSDLQKKIQDLENTISGLKSQESTLSSQIDVMDSQITLTEDRISATQAQIASVTADISVAGGKMKDLNNSLTDVSKILINRIVATYEAGNIQPIHILASSSDISSLVSRENYLRIVQDHDKHLMYNAQQAKDDYANQKNIFEDQKKQIEALQSQLQSYNTQLDQQKQSKQDLLSQTQGSEANYEQILANTKAQLEGFGNFTESQGGASLLSGQTVCDSWGCYYNQRDSQWGGNSLNGTPYSIASAGCLMTSMAMVYTHYGHRDVTPQSINSNSGNFDGIPAALLKYSISANGASATRNRIGSSASALPGTITDPIIVGISYDGGPYPDHFVVLISGSNGNYQMNDPFTPNGNDISFTSKYSLGSIVEVDSISM